MKKKVCLCQGQRSKIKKTFSLFICFRIGSRRNLVSIETKVQKNIDFFRVQRSKKHFLSSSAFELDLERNLVSIETKVQKNIDFFRVQRSKKHFLSFSASDTGYLVLFVLFTGKSKYFSTFLQYK
jgi:hypothetical protein